jgi:PKD repeat protein
MKNLFLFFSVLFSSFVSYSQCGNTDFELGNFTGWSGRLGNCCPINLTTNGLGGTRQVIMTQGIDPHSCGGLRTVYQGVYSARLGNDRVGAQAEGLSYTFTVTPATTIIRYAYAVVFQNPNHQPNEQPRFQSRVRLANGNIIPCTDYVVTAASGLPGFQYCTPIPPDTSFVAWRDWTEVAVDLTSYVGQTVRLEFETGDCALGGHYGYAYIDAVQCGKTDTHVTFCENDTTLTLTALGGFSSYHWQNGSTTQTTTINPQLYDTISCVVTTFTGCQLTLNYILDMTPGHPNFTYTPSCSGLVQFTNLSNASYSPINYLWAFPDGTTSTLENPSHLFTPGDYPVNLYISSNLGCGRDTTITIHINPSPPPSFTAPNVCIGNPTQFINTTSSIPGYSISYLWDFGDNGSSIQTNPTHTYLSVGTYNVTLNATVVGTGCSGSIQSQVTVYQTPTIQGGIIYY